MIDGRALRLVNKIESIKFQIRCETQKKLLLKYYFHQHLIFSIKKFILFKKPHILPK